MSKAPQFGTGVRVWVEGEQSWGIIQRVETCGRIRVLLDSGFFEFYQASQLIRKAVEANLNEEDN